MSIPEVKSIPDTPSFGVGYLKLPADSPDKIENYTLLDINPAFEELTGWNREHVLNKRVSEIFSYADPRVFSWPLYLENAARSGKTQETVQWFEEFKRYLKMTVIPSDNTSFMVIIQHPYKEEAITSQKEDLIPLLKDLNIIFNNTHDAISLVEYTKNGFQYVLNNIVHQRLTGFNNIRGLSPIQLVGGEVGRKLIKYYEQCVNTGQPVRYEQVFNFSPGSRVWQTELTPIFDEEKVRYLLCSSQDVSELQNIREEHEALNRRFQAMFEQHCALKVVFDSLTGKIVDANPAICSYFGYTKEEVLGHNVQEFNLLPPELQDERFQSILSGEALFFAAPHRLRSGETRFLDVYASPVIDRGQRLLYAILFDVTDRERYREELLQEKEMLRTTLHSIGDGVVTTDNDGSITSLNIVAQELTGWDNMALGRPFNEIFTLQNEYTGQRVEDPVQEVLKTGRIVGLANHTELINRHGRCIPIMDSAAPIKSEDGRINGVVMVFRDVSGEKEHSRQIEFLSYHDHLTGLYNRRYIEELIGRMDAAENLPISVIMGDVNGLKLINDVFGHGTGDRLLKHVSSLFTENCNKDDVIARWGGDEFVVVMPRTSLNTAETVIQKLKDIQIPINESSLSLSLSLGCASKDRMESNIQDVLQYAEKYMYHQKLLDGKSHRNAIISTLLATLYEKSNETEEHSKRIEKYCHSIGRKLRLSSKDMDDLSLLALLHDIGKVSIDPNILRKPGPLTPEEWDEMKRHPEIGYRIAQATPDLTIVADFILSHHERWDGKGYPRGLKEKEIPLVCRILAVADAFDAITNDRVYRKAMTIEEAILELKRNAGKQFDPQTTSLLIEIITNEEY